MADPVRLLSYNIHGAVGSDGCYAPERLAELLAAARADVIALQEVVHRAAGGRDLLDFLAARLAMHPIPGPTLMGSHGVYGNALLLPDAHATIERHDLSQPAREPRGLVVAHLHHRGRPVSVFNTHLGLRHRERRRQVARLAEIVDSRDDSRDDDLTVLVGDFNDWRPWRLDTLRPLRARFRDEFAPPTYPARRPLLALDRAFLRGPYRGWRGAVWRESGTLRASDHLPLLLEIDL